MVGRSRCGVLWSVAGMMIITSVTASPTALGTGLRGGSTFPADGRTSRLSVHTATERSLSPTQTLASSVAGVSGVDLVKDHVIPASQAKQGIHAEISEVDLKRDNVNPSEEYVDPGGITTEINSDVSEVGRDQDYFNPGGRSKQGIQAETSELELIQDNVKSENKTEELHTQTSAMDLDQAHRQRIHEMDSDTGETKLKQENTDPGDKTKQEIRADEVFKAQENDRESDLIRDNVRKVEGETASRLNVHHHTDPADGTKVDEWVEKASAVDTEGGRGRNQDVLEEFNPETVEYNMRLLINGIYESSVEGRSSSGKSLLQTLLSYVTNWVTPVQPAPQPHPVQTYEPPGSHEDSPASHPCDQVPGDYNQWLRDSGAVGVVVVGGGVAGMAAFSTLLRVGVSDIVLLEATDRLGGRVKTVRHSDWVVDEGPSWIQGGEDNPLHQIAKDLGRLGTPFKDLMPSHRVVSSSGDGVSLTVAEQHASVEQLVKHNTRQKLRRYYGRPLGDFYTDTYETAWGDVGDEKDRVASEYILHQDVGKEFGADSWRSFSARDAGNFKSLGQDYPWEGGMDGFVQYLLDKIPPTKIRLVSPVCKVFWDLSGGRGALVVTGDGTSYLARHIIVTLPLGVLKERHQHTFVPGLPPPLVTALQGVDSGAVNKVVLGWASAWWGKRPLNMLIFWRTFDFPQEMEWVSSIVRVQSASHHPGLLEFTVSGAASRTMEALHPDTVISHIIVFLRATNRDSVVPLPLFFHRSRWCSKMWSRGSHHSYVTMQGYDTAAMHDRALLAPRLINSNNKQTVVFGGEHTSTDRYGTVDGAFLSGVRAAHWLITNTDQEWDRDGEQKVVCRKNVPVNYFHLFKDPLQFYEKEKAFCDMKNASIKTDDKKKKKRRRKQNKNRASLQDDATKSSVTTEAPNTGIAYKRDPWPRIPPRISTTGDEKSQSPSILSDNSKTSSEYLIPYLVEVAKLNLKGGASLGLNSLLGDLSTLIQKPESEKTEGKVLTQEGKRNKKRNSRRKSKNKRRRGKRKNKRKTNKNQWTEIRTSTNPVQDLIPFHDNSDVQSHIHRLFQDIDRHENNETQKSSYFMHVKTKAVKNSQQGISQDASQIHPGNSDQESLSDVSPHLESDQSDGTWYFDLPHTRTDRNKNGNRKGGNENNTRAQIRRKIKRRKSQSKNKPRDETEEQASAEISREKTDDKSDASSAQGINEEASVMGGKDKTVEKPASPSISLSISSSNPVSITKTSFSTLLIPNKPFLPYRS